MSAILQQDEIRPADREASDRKLQGAQSFEKLVELAQRYLACEAVVLKVDRHGGRLHAEPGLGSVPEIGRVAGGCAVAAFRDGARIAALAGSDPRALTNPVVAGAMGMRFYAGLPLRDERGESIGVLAAIDGPERTLSAEEFGTLRLLAGMAVDLYEMQALCAG